MEYFVDEMPKDCILYNVKYTPPLTILEKIVTSCELF